MTFISSQIRQAFQSAAKVMFDNMDRLEVMIVRRDPVSATREDCVVCPGLWGSLLFPEFSSLSIRSVMEGHDHYKYVDVEMLRLSAHSGPLGIVPDQDQEFTAPQNGMYDLVIYNNDIELGRISLPAMTEGSTLSSLATRVGR